MQIPSYWHFSSHGRFDWDNARNAGLIMKNAETLTIGVLLDAEGSLGRPRLVVLSACETGLYDTSRNADEFVGLPATFMQRGAARTFGPTWFEVEESYAGLTLTRTILCPEGAVPWVLVHVRLALSGTATEMRPIRHTERWALRPRFLNVQPIFKETGGLPDISAYRQADAVRRTDCIARSNMYASIRAWASENVRPLQKSCSNATAQRAPSPRRGGGRSFGSCQTHHRLKPQLESRNGI
jgi:hypothetical protein